MSREYELFNGRYTVDIGKCGGIKVISNVAYGKTLKVNGKLRDGLRFVNMSSAKGEQSQSYCIEHIREHCLNGVDLVALTEDEVREMLHKGKPKPVLTEVTKIEQLEQQYDRYGNLCYVEYLEGYTRYYQKIDFTKMSNGLLKFNYRVTTFCEEDKTTTNTKTKIFSYPEKVTFTDVSQILDDELEEVFKLVSDEMAKRKLDVFHKEPVKP